MLRRSKSPLPAKTECEVCNSAYVDFSYTPTERSSFDASWVAAMVTIVSVLSVRTTYQPALTLQTRVPTCLTLNIATTWTQCPAQPPMLWPSVESRIHDRSNRSIYKKSSQVNPTLSTYHDNAVGHEYCGDLHARVSPRLLSSFLMCVSCKMEGLNSNISSPQLRGSWADLAYSSKVTLKDMPC